jgi:hypothetical protein
VTVTPASRVMFPIVAVACTTALALGAVIWKVAAGAVPGATEVNSVGTARPVRPTGSVPTEHQQSLCAQAALS